ncbi:NAD(P)-dependent oxidoreductase [Edaphobacter sp.]|uniref:NAD(P)-dependent oxidoreductase n=1 Tax=Edaphobacter sp. TaxID=1934404 RepID=UPI002DBBC435|nr:NAD(P)-dependent oxidoreductase [Edaphobacter sp.]HEU5341011.1 NAD(P)-dependent oxidoreductase [Edaphobacter sp.]
MNIVVYGATGKAGSCIVKELVARGHKVTGVARNVDSLKGRPGVVTKVDDLSNVDKIAAVIQGADAVVTAYQPPFDNTDLLVDVTKREIAAVKSAGVPRLLMVGGAGLLEVASGMTLMDSGHLPEVWLPIARSHRKALEALRASDINWTYLSPAAFFEPGERTGKFRLGTKELIADAKGESRISMEDYAIALVDEIENPRHERGSFSVGW